MTLQLADAAVPTAIVGAPDRHAVGPIHYLDPAPANDGVGSGRGASSPVGYEVVLAYKTSTAAWFAMPIVNQSLGRPLGLLA